MGKNLYYCKINSVVYNLSDIQELIDKNEFDGKITLAMYEKHNMEIIEASTFEEVIKFNNNEIPSDYNEALKRMQDRNQAQVQRMVANKPHCPTCNSTNVKPISGSERAVSVIGLGLFSKKIGKSYKCLNCKHTW